MAHFLNTSKAYASIEDAVDKAKGKVVLISPYIKIPESLLHRLKYVDGKGIKIVVVCRKKDLKDDVKNDLKQLRNLELRFDDQLHAKCFYNEETMVITSLNLLEFSQQNNREMGILLSLKDDREVFDEARKEAEFIIEAAEKDSAFKTIVGRFMEGTRATVAALDANLSEETNIRKSETNGYCIRCKKQIPFDREKPYCPECYKKWNKDPNNKENYCHSCGKEADIKFDHHLCHTCYRRMK
jgi:hypothetical protein